MANVPGRRIFKTPSIPAGRTPQEQNFFQQIWARLNHNHPFQLEGFFQNAVAANQTNVVLTLYQGNAPQVWPAPRGGLIHILWVLIDSPRTAGTLTLTPFKNGTAFNTGSVVIDGNHTTYNVTEIDDQLPFNAGDQLSLRITTTGTWAPTTANLRAGMYGHIPFLSGSIR